MVRKTFMLIAGEPSGDLLGGELVAKLRERLTDLEATPTADLQPLHASLEPEFFGAGGTHMEAAGVKICVDLTRHSVVGLWEVIKKYQDFRRIFRELVRLTIAEAPDVIICIDFSGFNLRFARAIRHYQRSRRGGFGNWDPKLVQYVSPQVWASRPERAHHVARYFDLVLSIIPFETEWYAQRVPDLEVVYVGHPLMDRYIGAGITAGQASIRSFDPSVPGGGSPRILLLPGSRPAELRAHLPVMLEALARLQTSMPNVKAGLVVPNERLAQLARLHSLPSSVELKTGALGSALATADLAIASTGTVTLECAYFGVPTVALYKTSWLTYQIGKRLVQVDFLAMPNLIAREELFPELIQHAATPEALANAARELLLNPARRGEIKAKLAAVVHSLGAPGASNRAAAAIIDLIKTERVDIRAALTV